MKIRGVIEKNLLVPVVLSLCLWLTVSCTVPPATPPETDEEEPTTYQMEINLLGTKHEVAVNSQGKVESSTQVASVDDTISLSIDKDTILLDKDEKRIQAIQATIDPNPPPPPEDADYVSSVYDLRPQGVTFNPPLKLTLSYVPDELPEGLRENDVYIACYQDGKWEKLRYKQVDTERHRVATQINRLTRYAVLISSEQSTPTPDPGLTPEPERVDVVYFHRTNRCHSCTYAEEQTVYTLETYFKEELNNGKLTFTSVDVQDESNIAVIEKYGAYTSQLFINTVMSDTEHIEHVAEIWQLIGNDDAFTLLIQNKITNALEGSG